MARVMSWFPFGPILVTWEPCRAQCRRGSVHKVGQSWGFTRGANCGGWLSGLHRL